MASTNDNLRAVFSTMPEIDGRGIMHLPFANFVSHPFLSENLGFSRSLLDRGEHVEGQRLAPVADAWKMGDGSINFDAGVPDDLVRWLATVYGKSTTATSGGNHDHEFASDGSGATVWSRSLDAYLSRADGRPMWFLDAALSEITFKGAVGALVGVDLKMVPGSVSGYGVPTRTGGAGTGRIRVNGWDGPTFWGPDSTLTAKTLTITLSDQDADSVTFEVAEGAGDPVEFTSPTLEFFPLLGFGAKGSEPAVWFPAAGLADDDVFTIAPWPAEVAGVYSGKLPFRQISSYVTIGGALVRLDTADLTIAYPQEPAYFFGRTIMDGRTIPKSSSAKIALKRRAGTLQTDDQNRYWNRLKANGTSGPVVLVLDTEQDRGDGSTYRYVLEAPDCVVGGDPYVVNQGSERSEGIDLTPLNGIYTLTAYTRTAAA